MARKRERILSRYIEEEMRESFLDYSMSVIVQRALPDVHDGLKPVHRRILYAMYDLGLIPGRPYKKSASVVGEVLGKYHPHGDTAVYDSLVRMVQDFSLRYPLVDGQGNFGSVDGDSAAAYRYTEARLTSVAMDLLDDIEAETVDWSANFDNRLEEPIVLPGKIPNLLVNGSSGIAVGMSTNIPPHNLGEVANGIRALIADPEITNAGLAKHVPGPDFPTAGFIVGADGIRDMYETGRGRVVMRARIVREALRGGRQQLVVTELPYAVTKSKVVEQIADLSRKGKVDEVADLRDESDRDGIRVVIELKRGSDAAQVLKVLYKRTQLQNTFGAILLALDHGQPREFDLKGMMAAYRDHRLEVIERRTRHELTRAENEYHITQGLLIALDAIDEVIRIIRESADRPEASRRLQEALDLSEAQCDAILNMRLGKLTGLETAELRDRLSELEAILEHLEAILGSEERRLEVLLEELDDVVERHANPRRTEILYDTDEKEVPVESEIADEDVVVTLSHQGFVKRMPVSLYRRRVGSGKALAGMERYEDDWLERVFAARTQGWLLAFTSGGQVHFLPVLDLPESGRSSRGQSIYALASADREDPIVAVTPVDQLDDPARFVVSLSEGGLVKRTALSEFSHPRAGGVIAVGVKGGDRVLDVRVSEADAELLLLTAEGRAIRFSIDDVPVMGRTARGVKGVGLRGVDRAVGMLVLRRDAAVLTVTEKALGRRTDVDEFPVQKRGGLGTVAVSPDKAGSLVGALEVLPEDEVVLMHRSGTATRIAASEVPLQSRRGKGKVLVKLRDDGIVEVARGLEHSPKRGPESGGPVADTVAPDDETDALEASGNDDTEAADSVPAGSAASQLDLLGNGGESDG